MEIISGIRRERGLAILSSNGTVLLTIRLKDLNAHPVQEGDELDPEEYINQIAPGQLGDAYEAALSMLDRSAKTARQIEISLARKGYVTVVVQSVIERLVDNKLINDASFAARMAEAANRSGTGVYALKQKMRAKGLADEDVEAALESIDEDSQRTAARALCEKLAHRYEDQPRAKARAKLSQALARRGFSWDVISSVMSERD